MVSPGGGVLAGLRVVVTRARARTQGLAWGLESLGAAVQSAPLIAIAAPLDPAPLEAAARGVGGYDWVVFTSANGVERFGMALAVVGASVSALAGVRVACIGPGTAAAAEELGLWPELIPESAIAESMLQALIRTLAGGGDSAGGGGEASSGGTGSEFAGARILLPVAAGARSVIERGLARRGAEVHRVEAYRTVPDPEGMAVLLPLLRSGCVDVLIFASPSAVEFFVDGVGAAEGGAAGAAEMAAAELVRGVLVAAIGPVTAAAAVRRGLAVGVEAAEHTVQGLVSALAEYYR